MAQFMLETVGCKVNMALLIIMTKMRLIKEKVAECRHTCSELELNGYVDGQLSCIEQGFVLEAAMQSTMKSAEIRTRLNELEQLKVLVRISYTQI